MTQDEKIRTYETLQAQVASVLEGSTDLISCMASVACLIREAFPELIFAGFYRNRDGVLHVGPYQGSLACMVLPRGKGVCGASLREGRTFIVPDVHAFRDHIACDSRAESEIVIPVRDNAGRIIAVLDLDSPKMGTFDQTDARFLEGLAAILASKTD